MTKTRGQLISMLQSMKSTPNGNAIKHIKYEDINAICDYLSTDKNTLKSLVEKASPKKIIYDKGYNGERLFFCPNCNKSMPKCSFFAQYRYPYCPYCGQSVDWSEWFSD